MSDAEWSAGLQIENYPDVEIPAAAGTTDRQACRADNRPMCDQTSFTSDPALVERVVDEFSPSVDWNGQVPDAALFHGLFGVWLHCFI